jgi:cis-L-3-hydroxyproline dehydratase
VDHAVIELDGEAQHTRNARARNVHPYLSVSSSQITPLTAFPHLNLPAGGDPPAEPKGSAIVAIDLFSYELTYVGGEYVMSGNRVITSLSSTVARVQTADGHVGFGETCPLGANYLPAHAAGVRAALQEVAPHVLGADACNPAAVSRTMDAALLGHGYGKAALDIACWDVLGQVAGLPLCDLLGGRQQEQFALYTAISHDTPERMRAQVEAAQGKGIHRFQLKLGNDPAQDAARAHAVAQATRGEDVVFADANCGWSVVDAITAARSMEDLPGFFLEQPCRTYEECLQVRARTSLPMILDEVIFGVQDLLRAWQDRALEGINLKISRVGGLTKARVLRDTAQALGLVVNIEDSWGGDVTTAAVSHLAASTPAETARMVSFMNDWTNEHIAGHEPRSHDGWGGAPRRPGLGVAVDETALGSPFATFRA